MKDAAWQSSLKKICKQSLSEIKSLLSSCNLLIRSNSSGHQIAENPFIQWCIYFTSIKKPPWKGRPETNAYSALKNLIWFLTCGGFPPLHYPLLLP
jgi:hypothetical protein